MNRHPEHGRAVLLVAGLLLAASLLALLAPATEAVPQIERIREAGL